MSRAARSFFVYGTLKRGQCRESCWPAEPISITEASVKGKLFDLGPYPAMTPGNDEVAGELWTFNDKDVSSVCEVLDEIEGFNQPGSEDLYLRTLVDTLQFVEANTYIYVPVERLNHQQRIWPVDGNPIQWPSSG